MNDIQTRNEEIYKDRSNGMTYSALSKKYGLCMEQVRKICDKKERISKMLTNAPDNSIYKTMLSNRTKNALIRSGITTTDELRDYFENNFAPIKSLGDKGVLECREFLGMDLDDFRGVKICNSFGEPLLTAYTESFEQLSDTEVRIGKTRIRFEQPVKIKI